MSHLYGEELAPGALVGPFAIERTCSRGETSFLYLARDTRTRRQAAVKLLRSEYAFAPNALRRFQQEAATLKALRHPNIVELLDFGDLIDGRPYLAMEWLEGRDLAAELAARGHLRLEEAAEVMEQVGGALGAAHAASIIHRDLKTQNVMVLGGTAGLRVKLVDFGIAKPLATGPGTALTSTGRMLGTPVAMAPEQIRGGAVDARTDLYSLGVMLFQVLAGRPPFQAPSVLELQELHLHAPAPRVSRFAAVPPGVDALVLRCLEKKPESRYPDVASFLAELRRALGSPTAAPAAVRRAAAIYVKLGTGEDAGDDVLDRVDALVELARSRLAAEKLPARVDGADFLLGIALLPEDAEEERQERGRVLELARALFAALEEARAGAPVRVEVTVHAAPARAGASPGTLEGEELLSPGRWAARPPNGGLAATAAAMEGLSAPGLPGVAPAT